MNEYLHAMQKSEIASAVVDGMLNVVESNGIFHETFLGVDRVFPSGFYAGKRPDFSAVLNGSADIKSVVTVLNIRGKRLIYNLRLIKADADRYYFCAIQTGGGLNRHNVLIRSVEKIRKNRRSLDMLMNRVNGLVFINDNDSIFYANAAAVRFLGYDSFEELEKSGRCLCSFFENTEKQTLTDVSEWKEMIASGSLKGDESIACMVNRNTDEFHYFLADVAVNNADNQDFITVLTDITDVLDSTKMKSADNEKFKQMFLGHSAPMILVDQEDGGRIIGANPAACRFYGYERAELTSLTIDYLNIMPVDAIRSEMMKAKAKARNYFNFIHRMKDGNVKNVEVYSSPIDYNGKKVLFSIILDSTEKKLYEIQLKDMNHRLNTRITAEMQHSREQDKYCRGILELNRDATFIFRIENGMPSDFRDYNAAAEKLTGDAVKGNIFDVLNALGIDGREELIDGLLGNDYIEKIFSFREKESKLVMKKAPAMGEGIVVVVIE